MTRSREERIAALEAKYQVSPLIRPRKRSVGARVRAARVLVDEAFVLIEEANRLLAATEGDRR
jgi:hypothetical protein